MTGARNDPPPHRYRIRIRGRLGETMRSAFPGLQARPSGADTLLTGALSDQAALHGVLAEIEALGLELLEVHRLPPACRPRSLAAGRPHPQPGPPHPSSPRRSPPRK